MAAEPNQLSKAATDASMKFAMDAIDRMPKDNPEALEAHITAVLIVFWGALWGTLGTKYARGFIEAQLRGMEPDQQHDVFTPPRLQ
jgi:hypothetical protein